MTGEIAEALERRSETCFDRPHLEESLFEWLKEK